MGGTMLLRGRKSPPPDADAVGEGSPSRKSAETRTRAEERRALVRSLHEQGLSKTEIAKRVGIDVRNVLGPPDGARPRAAARRSAAAAEAAQARSDRVVGGALDVRMRAAHSLIGDGVLEGPEAQSLLAVAVWPPETVYWVPTETVSQGA